MALGRLFTVGPMDALTFIDGMHINPIGNIPGIIMEGISTMASRIASTTVMGGRMIDIVEISEERVVEEIVVIVGGAGKKHCEPS